VVKAAAADAGASSLAPSETATGSSVPPSTPAIEGHVTDFLQSINPVKWFSSHTSAPAPADAPAPAAPHVFEMFNPTTWFKATEHAAPKQLSPQKTQDVTRADAAAVEDTLGFPADFFSPEGSRMSDGEQSASASVTHSSSSGSSSGSSTSGSSHTSDVSDAPYVSSSDSGSGSTAPAEDSEGSNIYEWRTQLKQQLSSSSDVVDMGDDSDADDW